MARLSYTSTSSCDSYSAYHRSKAGLTAQIMPRVLGTLSVVGKDVKGAMVGGGQERLSDAQHQSWNHQVKGAVVGGGREKLSDAQHQKRAIKYGRRGITDPKHPIGSQDGLSKQ
ncbi:hypothetical protein V498_03841 [Pseudogymnoascus sp. VKM F-4517 (FW-2822)]|nr:hypothetical protein V498_03841 [Pseudogymnoascus sp. VKM F-4517 (FW-2822)]